jgi:cobalt-zinc-cadmium efflux system membrane fusion protein
VKGIVFIVRQSAAGTGPDLLVGRRRNAGVAAAILAINLVLAGCSREQPVNAATASVKMEPPRDPNTFQVNNPDEFPLVEVALRSTRIDVSATGVVAPDVNRTVAVNSLTGGRVIDIHARLGDDVRKGDVLLRISSSDLAAAISDYQKAVTDEILARRQRDRERDLYEHGAAALKDVEVAEDAEAKALVDLKTTAERVRILGGDVNHPSSVVEVKAPVSGTIVEQNITPAAGVKSLDNSPNLFTIADLSHVWILCDVYENNLAQVRLGDYAEVRLNAYPDKVLKGRVSNISRVLDPNTRTAKVRLEVPNPSGILRPGMFATARFTSQNAVHRMVLPQTAILRLHDKDWVFRQVGTNLFRRDEIQGGEVTPDGYQFVLSGVRPGEQVVKNALQMSASAEK